jgi:hypothetical protein
MDQGPTPFLRSSRPGYIVSKGENASRVASVLRHFENFFSGIALNPSLTGTALSGLLISIGREVPMSDVDYEAAVAAFLRTKGITRCPTVCVVPTQATIAEADRAAYRDYVSAKEAARLEKLKSAQQIVPLPPDATI